jgi:hypothetical protein
MGVEHRCVVAYCLRLRLVLHLAPGVINDASRIPCVYQEPHGSIPAVQLNIARRAEKAGDAHAVAKAGSLSRYGHLCTRFRRDARSKDDVIDQPV